jgi:hypothetical protein
MKKGGLQRGDQLFSALSAMTPGDPDPPAECRQRCSTRQRLASLFLLLGQNFTIAHACTFRHTSLRTTACVQSSTWTRYSVRLSSMYGPA